MHRRARRPPRRNVETKAQRCRQESFFSLTHWSPRQQHAHVRTHACSCSMLLHTFAHTHTTKSTITPSDHTPRYPETPPSAPKKAHKEATRPEEDARETKDAEPSSVLSPRRPETDQSDPKKAREEQRWLQDGPKTARRWPQDSQKTTPRRTGEATSRNQNTQNWRLV